MEIKLNKTCICVEKRVDRVLVSIFQGRMCLLQGNSLCPNDSVFSFLPKDSWSHATWCLYFVVRKACPWFRLKISNWVYFMFRSWKESFVSEYLLLHTFMTIKRRGWCASMYFFIVWLMFPLNPTLVWNNEGGRIRLIPLTSVSCFSFLYLLIWSFHFQKRVFSFCLKKLYTFCLLFLLLLISLSC